MKIKLIALLLCGILSTQVSAMENYAPGSAYQALEEQYAYETYAGIQVPMPARWSINQSSDGTTTWYYPDYVFAGGNITGFFVIQKPAEEIPDGEEDLFLFYYKSGLLDTRQITDISHVSLLDKECERVRFTEMIEKKEYEGETVVIINDHSAIAVTYYEMPGTNSGVPEDFERILTSISYEPKEEPVENEVPETPEAEGSDAAQTSDAAGTEAAAVPDAQQDIPAMPAVSEEPAVSNSAVVGMPPEAVPAAEEQKPSNSAVVGVPPEARAAAEEQKPTNSAVVGVPPEARAAAEEQKPTNSAVVGVPPEARAAASAGSDIPSAGAQEAPGIPAPDPQQDTGSTGEKSAIQSAREYLAISAFSKQGLIDQLVYEGFSESEAENAVGSISIDWKEQAYESAKEYLDIMNFTISDLTAQLVYDGFTSEEVTYGVDKAYHR